MVKVILIFTKFVIVQKSIETTSNPKRIQKCKDQLKEKEKECVRNIRSLNSGYRCTFFFLTGATV